jgi:hypothetical protein
MILARLIDIRSLTIPIPPAAGIDESFDRSLRELWIFCHSVHTLQN